MSNWINIKDELPNTHTEVLVSNGKQVLASVNYNGLNKWYCGHRNYSYSLEDYPKWQYYPKP